MEKWVKNCKWFVNPNNTIKIMREADTLNNLDIFSLDIDGIDYWILKELPKDFSKIAIVEFNQYLEKILRYQFQILLILIEKISLF